MTIQTFSILAGSEACNARCPFCVSKMTPPQGITPEVPEVNWRNFRKAALLAKQKGVTTAMITSKGEPTLFPEQITEYIDILQEFQFPIIELQTNGINLAEEKNEKYLKEWYEKGLTTIAISIVHYDAEKNRQIYLPYRKEYIDLVKLVDKLHKIGFSVRFACILLDGFIDNSTKLEKLISFAKENKVEQLTIRPVNKPNISRNLAVFNWVSENYLKEEHLEDMIDYLNKEGIQLMHLNYEAVVYDVNGQNVCLTNSLTIDPNSDNLRQLIFFPDGHLRYDWQYVGAILI